MPNTALEEALKEAYATAPSNIIVLNTIELQHPKMTSPIVRFVQAHKDYMLGLENRQMVRFEAGNFAMTLPTSNADGLADINLTVDDVDRRVSGMIAQVGGTADPLYLRYRPYLSTDLTKPQMKSPITLVISEVQVNLTQISARASFVDMVNKKFLTQLYTRRRFPGLGDYRK